MKTQKMKIYILGLLLALVFGACEDDDVKKENQAPSKPMLQTPANKAENVLLKPTFKWAASVDPEKAEVTYELLLSKDEKFTEANTKKAIDIKQPQFTFSNYDLERFTTYYWKVIAYDDKKAKTESDVYSFKTVDVDLRITLLTPKDKAALTEKNTEVSWDVKRSPLYKGEVTYSLFLRNGSAEFSMPFKKGLTETKSAVNGLKGNGNYFWKVVAIDKDDVEVASSEVFSFTTPNTPPTAPQLNEIPVQVLSKDGVDVTIKWTASVDEDKVMDNGTLRKEKLTYDVYLSTDNTFESDDLKEEALEAVEFTFAKLAFETAYWVKVVVKDENEGVVDSNVVNFTTKKKSSVADFTATEGTWTDTRDGKEYKTITINGKTWLAENFAYVPYIEENDADGNKKICSVYGLDNPADVAALKANANYAKYGVLYSGYAVAADIAPAGWHVATDADWKELEKLSGMTETEVNATGKTESRRGVTMHTFIAEGEPFDSSLAEQPTNEMKTAVKYGGYVSVSWSGVKFKGEGIYTYFWTGTKFTPPFGGGTAMYHRAFSSKRKTVERDSKGLKYRMYVRLVKD